MEQKLTCDTIRDLLPMYVDDMTSEATNELIKEHLSECKECNQILENMKQPVVVETAPEVKDFKKYLKKSRASILYWIMGVLTGYLPIYVMVNSEKHPFVKGIAVANGCTFLLVAVVQVVLY
ncbi:zf-HC2 domain-containing protein [Roseburia sp. 499]|uniref:zf-HC2 domain-containing protein n=1 Tax=Roseburia sp. 499 TaxID=1261634 RepID=UPI000952D392|nr:zf-HC2 domain-containing protein [Roseburia sp. 499]WVK71075.1 zf-HC2 domain-containing protein [Roseburia sp. 499]